MSSDTNLATYGPMADMYATQYGIPTDVFRSAISAVSNFDPNYVSDSGVTGLSGLNINVGGKDGSDPSTALSTAAQVISSNYSTQGTGDWADAVSSYFDDANTSVPSSGASTSTANSSPSSTQQTTDGKYIWQYTSDDFKNIFDQYAYGALVSIVGILLIVGSIWVLLIQQKKSGTS